MHEFIAKRKEGILLVRENALNLFASAKLLSTSSFFSPAISILILSSEETIKGYALCLEIFLGDESEVAKIINKRNAKDKNSYMYNHKEKHRLAHAIISDLSRISLVVNLLKISTKGKIREGVSFLSLPTGEKEKIDLLLNDLDSFNKTKNAGFYVDFDNDIWHTPLKFGELDYLKIMRSATLLQSIFFPKIEFFLDFPNKDLALLYDALKN